MSAYDVAFLITVAIVCICIAAACHVWFDR